MLARLENFVVEIVAERNTDREEICFCNARYCGGKSGLIDISLDDYAGENSGAFENVEAKVGDMEIEHREK